MSAAIVIPMRFASTRLHAKPLLADTGKTLAEHVVENARRIKNARCVIVATDDERIAGALRNTGVEIRMTSPAHQSGTDRVAEVAQNMKDDLIINLQGDEPTMDGLAVEQLISNMTKEPNILMGTLACRPANQESRERIIKDPNAVKVVVDENSNALYFSRAGIPFLRDESDKDLWQRSVYKHLGVYAYRREFLLDFAAWPPSTLEKIERLEQLRALERGVKIRVCFTDHEAIGIDTAEDYERFKKYLSAGK